MPLTLTETQAKVLATIVDTFVPSLDVPSDPNGYYATSGTQRGADLVIAGYVGSQVPPTDQAALLGLLDAIAGAGLLEAEAQVQREALLHAVAGSSPEAAVGVGVLRTLAILFAYAITDSNGTNPFLDEFGYPGQPPRPADARGKTLTTLRPEPGQALQFDAVVVGSGAGGGVAAAELSAAGKSVLVIEKGGYYTEQDFPATELGAYSLFLRGGPTPSADGKIVFIAGGTVGGGTTVNWSNSLRLPGPIRRRWAEEFGLDDVDTAEFDAHMDAIFDRMKVNRQVAEQNTSHALLAEAAQRLGWSYADTELNIDPDRYDGQRAGFTTFGDQSGGKQGSLLTWLQDASDRGAQLLPNTDIDRVILKDGRAAGVEGTFHDPETGDTVPVTVEAPIVVVACGSIETPALLLRSGIGGPAVGKTLHVHPVAIVSAEYAIPIDPWEGPAQAGLVNQFSEPEHGFGYLVENFHHLPAFTTALVPWTDGYSHKQLAARYRYRADWMGLVHDRGNGSVELDPHGWARVYYPFSDDLDRENYYAAVEAAVRLHHAAGAIVIYSDGQPFAPWRVGDNLEAFIAQLQATPIGAGGLMVGSAHQMSSAPMGRDPRTSVANADGELHDTPGVWIADASAMPTASAVNPMVSVMALARRTAHRILANNKSHQPTVSV